MGGSRLVLAVLCDALAEESVPAASGEASTRTVLRLHEDIAPYRAAVSVCVRGARFFGGGGGSDTLFDRVCVTWREWDCMFVRLSYR